MFEAIECFRDLFYISTIKSEKYCGQIPPSQSGREYLQTEDHRMYVWLRLGGPTFSPAWRSVRLVVTPVLKTCDTSDIWWTPCGQSGPGPCVRRDLLCDGIVNCGAREEAEERCRTRVKTGEPSPGSWLLPSLVSLLCSGIFITGFMLFCCTFLNRHKIRNSFHENQADTRPQTPGYEAATAPELEDRPPSYAEAILLPRP